MNAYVNGTASLLPNAPVSGDDIEKVLGAVRGKPSFARARILRSNGIVTRHYAVDPETGRATHTNAALTAEAVRRLAERTGVGLDDGVDLLACGTATPDQLMPSHGSMVHGELRSPPCEVFTASGGCCASSAAFKYAALAVAAGEARRAVVTGSEVVSPLLRARHFEPEMEERLKALEKSPHLAFEHDFLRYMLSDGAAAVLLEPEPVPRGGAPSLRVEWVDSVSFAGEMEVCMYHGGMKGDGRMTGWKDVEDPHERVRRGFFNIGQDARLLNSHIGRVMGEALGLSVRKHGLRPDNLSWVLPHLSSYFFRDEVGKQFRDHGLPVPPDRYFTNLAERGNTGAASIFVMLDEFLGSGRARPGETILCFVPERARFSAAVLFFTVCAP